MIDTKYKKGDKAVSRDSFMLKYCLDRYKTQGMCNKAADVFYKQ